MILKSQNPLRDFVRNRIRMLRLGLAIASLGSALAASAANYTWVGLSGDDWSTPASWAPAVVPNTIGDSIRITNSVLISMTNVPVTTFTLGGITNAQVSSSSTTIGQNSTTDDILTLQVASGSPVIEVTNAAQALFLYFTLNGNQGLTKTGAGRATFRFNGVSNTLSGPINILGGVLGIEKDETLGDPANAINIANGARLTAEPGNGGNVFSLASTRVVTLTGAAQVGVSGAAVSFSLPVVTGTGDLRKTDAGTLILNGSANYAGETRVLGGGVTYNTTSLVFTQQNFCLLQAQASGFIDASALTNYAFSNGAKSFQVIPNTTTGVGVGNDFYLAKSGAFGGLNTITASAMQIGGGSASAGSLHEGRLHLGTTNIFNLNTNGMLIGGFNAAGVIDFQGGLTSPYLKIRGTNGSARMAGTFKIGETSSGTRSGAGTLNLSGGVLDAQVTDVILGRHISNANNSESSTLTFDDGNLDAITFTMAEKDNGGAGASWPTLNDTVNQNGGSIKVAKFVMGNDLKLTNLIVINATYNLNNGTLYAGSIGGGVGGYNTVPTCNRTFNLNGGVLRNYDSTSNLVINGVGQQRYARITLNIGGAASLYADANRSITIGTNAAIEGALDFTKDGPGELAIDSLINTGTGKLTVNAGTLSGTGLLLGAVEITAAAKLSPGHSTGTLTISNDVILAGTTLMELNFNSGVVTNSDLLAGVTNLTYGGTLVLTNLGGAIPVGQSFKLFDAAAYTGSFSTVVPPVGYTVSTANLGVNGTITITGAPITNPKLTFERDGTDFVFSWTPASGFKLQAQTNSLSAGIGNSWFDVPGGSTPPVIVPFGVANPSVFFRLISTP